MLVPSSLPSFAGTSCVSPPVPPAQHFLVGNFTQPIQVPFGESVKYTCPPGLFFGSDKALDAVSVTCYPDGSMPEPSAWERCFHPSRE